MSTARTFSNKRGRGPFGDTPTEIRRTLTVVAERRPRVRGDCAGGLRPCPWVSCRHHLAIEVSRTGGLKLCFPEVAEGELEALPDTCSLDVADRGGQTLDEIGERLNVIRERVRQIEVAAMLVAGKKLRARDLGPDE